MKIANPKNYLNYLTDVYNGEISNQALCKKHGVGHQTTTSCKKLGLTDVYNYSKMQMEPKLTDAKKIIALNSKYTKNMIEQRQFKLKLGQPVKEFKPRKKKQALPIAEKPSKGREISILWGMIKIKS
jgi:hypothetical protein